jgi:cardiolipin synthase
MSGGISMKNVPNILTVIRMALIPVFVYVFFSEAQNSRYLALGVYAVASLTDLVDGYIARKYDVVTDVGKVLDPLADKLMLLTVLVCLYISGDVPGLILAIVLMKEGFMITIGLILYHKKDRIVVPANYFGKSATVLFTVSIVLVFLFPGNANVMYLMYISIVLKFIALFKYYFTYQAERKRRGL